jgi:hypothetical protein
MTFKKLPPPSANAGNSLPQGKDRPAFRGKGTIKPLWNLYRDGLTQGSINLFLQCREQFRLTYVEGWSPKAQSDALEFGSCFHDCLAHMDFDKHSVAQAMKLYKKKQPSLAGKELQDRECLHAQVAILLEHYRKKWGKVDADREWVLREETFNQHLHDSLRLQLASYHTQIFDIPLRGRFDGIFRQKKVLWLHETKTKQRIDEEGIQMGLPFDLQTMLYMYVAEQTLGEPIAGVCYDVIRRPGLRQGKGTLESLLARIEEDVKKQPTHYFMRWDMSLTKQDLPRWVKQQLIPILTEIVEWWESIRQHPLNPWDSPKHYMNPANLNNQYGRCPLYRLITTGSMFGLYQRKFCYPELQD